MRTNLAVMGFAGFRYEDFGLVNYEPWPAIEAPGGVAAIKPLLTSYHGLYIQFSCMKTWLLVLGFCGVGVVAKAQGRSQVYAAPGMPGHLQHGLPTEVVRARKPFLTEPMPRFWLETDTAMQVKGLNQVLNEVRSRLNFPKGAMVEGVSGRIIVRAVLSPEGVPLTPQVVGRSSTLATVDKKVVDLLDAETIRVVQLLRFKPKAGSPDTLTVPMSYFFQ